MIRAVPCGNTLTRKRRRKIKLRGLQGQQQSSDASSYQAFNLQQTTKLDQAIEAAHKLVDDSRLLPTDKVTIIHFDTEAAALVPLTAVAQRQLLHQAIDSLRDHSGQTFMAKGMACAQQQLCDLPKETAKRVVLLTDGATQQEGQCRRLAGEFAEANTPVIAIGIGPEYKEKLMLELAAGRAKEGRTTWRTWANFGTFSTAKLALPFGRSLRTCRRRWRM